MEEESDVLESESESEVEVVSESESESDDESEVDESKLDDPDLLDLRAFFLLSDVGSFSFSRSFSFSSRIRLAVPVFVVNSSGTSTEGLPSALSFASTSGFSSICVRDGRDT